jgi:hypothetical protein
VAIVPSIALEGLQVGLLGTPERLSVAAANSDGAYDLSCFTDQYRVGMYFNRTPNLELMGWVVGGQLGPIMRRNGAQVDMDVPGTLSVQGVPITGGGFTAVNKDVSIIRAGQALTADPSGSGVLVSYASSTAAPCCGLAFTDVDPLAAVTVRTGGQLTLADWTLAVGTPTLAPRGVYYLSPDLPGHLTLVAPTAAGQVVQQIGIALSLNVLLINISPYVLL